MTRLLQRSVAISVMAGVLASSGVVAAAGPDPADAAKAQAAIDRGLRWLRSVQKPDGSWGGHLGITAMVLTAFARSHRRYREDDGPFMRNAAAHVRAAVKPSGAIAQSGGNEMYTTALSLLALKALDNPADAGTIASAQAWIKSQQTDEAQGYRPDDKLYGGFGYGSSLRPDLSNTQYAIEALRMSGVPASDPALAKAIRFIQRVQNRSESNDQPVTVDDGGFAYLPGFTFAPAGGTASMGSMTYAGIKSYIWADMPRDDPRVQAAMKWIAARYTLDENPGMGSQGLYYYFDVFARTWTLLDVDTVVTADGARRAWYHDLVTKLVAEQRPEGYWVNGRSARFWEDRPELSTAHALLALIYGLERGARR
jgi:squalene-hopene/tetraprenyl-beta-curcumene cyclase